MKSPKLTFLFGALALLIMLAMIQRGKWLSVETVMGAALIVNFGGLSLAYGGAGDRSRLDPARLELGG